MLVDLLEYCEVVSRVPCLMGLILKEAVRSIHEMMKDHACVVFYRSDRVFVWLLSK